MSYKFSLERSTMHRQFNMGSAMNTAYISDLLINIRKFKQECRTPTNLDPYIWLVEMLFHFPLEMGLK